MVDANSNSRRENQSQKPDTGQSNNIQTQIRSSKKGLTAYYIDLWRKQTHAQTNNHTHYIHNYKQCNDDDSVLIATCLPMTNLTNYG